MIVLTDDMVSRNHATVQQNGEEYFVTDYGSRNGTTLNGRPVTVPTRLQDGDKVLVGPFELVFRCPVPAPAGPPDTPLGFTPEGSATRVSLRRSLITVLVIDIRNYTVLTRELGDAQISDIMSKVFQMAGNLLNRNGSWGQKYIGDAIMAVWAHSLPHITTAEFSAVLKSLVELRSIIDRVNTHFALPKPLSFGAGINTGFAALGNMGSAALSDYTALGDAVNKAFRLESASKELKYDIVIGKDTFDWMSPPFRTSEHLQSGSARLKGFDDPQPVFGLKFDRLADFVAGFLSPSAADVSATAG
jgi:adenylate cyclase